MKMKMVDKKPENSARKRLIAFFSGIRKYLRSKKFSLCVTKQKVDDDLQDNSIYEKRNNAEDKKVVNGEAATIRSHVAPSNNLATSNAENGTRNAESATRADNNDGNNANETNANGRRDIGKFSLSEELIKLNKYAWYWGAISGDEADAKLIGEPDGAFLVRNSKDHRFLLTLSFKSSGKSLHARMRINNGLFSLCNPDESEGFTSVAALILHTMKRSQSAVVCYSRPKHPGHPRFPVRLTKPVCRFTHVQSLQYLCRSTIRGCTSYHNIRHLPIPKNMRNYVEEACF